MERQDFMSMMEKVDKQIQPPCDEITIKSFVSNSNVLCIEFMWARYPKNIYYTLWLSYAEIDASIEDVLGTYIVKRVTSAYADLES